MSHFPPSGTSSNRKWPFRICRSLTDSKWLHIATNRSPDQAASVAFRLERPALSSFTNRCSTSFSGVLFAAHSIKLAIWLARSRDSFESARPDWIIGTSAAAALRRLSVADGVLVIVAMGTDFTGDVNTIARTHQKYMLICRKRL